MAKEKFELPVPVEISIPNPVPLCGACLAKSEPPTVEEAYILGVIEVIVAGQDKVMRSLCPEHARFAEGFKREILKHVKKEPDGG